jgi:hypothetical protein
MRLLADENFPAVVVDRLRAEGHDVCWIRTESPGVSDDVVLARALAEQRILLSFDKDFGELVFRCGSNASCGIVLFRMPLALPDVLATSIVAVVASRQDWAGHFSVVEQHRVRMRPLP